MARVASRVPAWARSPWAVAPVAGALVLGGWVVLRPDAEPATAATVATEQVVEVGTGTTAETVSAQGTVANAEQEDLAFATSGTVTSVLVAAGDQVVAGQVLATVDDTALRADLAQAQADLADAQATLEDDTDAGESDARLAVDATRVTTAEETVADAEDALAGASLVAGFDGTVASVDLTVGEVLADGTGGTSTTGSGSGSGQSSGSLVGASTQTVPGATTSSGGSTESSGGISVVSTGAFVVELELDSVDVEQVAVGQSVEVSPSTATSSTSAFGGFPGGGGGVAPPGMQSEQGSDEAAAPSTTGDVVATGTVTEVGTTADASSGVAQYAVTVEFTDTTGDLLAGSAVQVDITVSEPTDALTVPAFAVTTADDETSTVTVRTDDGDEVREVELGEQSGMTVVVLSGLEAGEQVVVTAPGRGGEGGAP